ncbi:CarD family transcriptional regulator [uncultured Subdoligranulum sp.]|uniref:CarD family transcriptional regulator n=1 Tax=uncultured Subdoligranulum sp. TaxID=512298 RepID=UPI00262D5F66|nr:CarD family transcriptional regulator [uncultured Subdoligranulum sp.]
MFQVGDAVSYGTSGVCTIAEKKSMKLAGQACECYILKPVYDSSMKICVPCNSQVLLDRMRALPTKQEVLDLLHEPAPEHDPDPEARKERYRRTLQSGDRHALLRMIRDIYTERRHRHAMGKQLSSYEDSALREAQNILHSEVAYTMGIDPQEVPDFIAGILEDAANA